MAILWAGMSADEPSWVEIGIETLHASTGRSSGVVDAGLCHGAAGLAHIYNRAFHATGDARFLQAALVWFQKTVNMQTDHGYGGFQSFMKARDATVVENPWRDDLSFLSGAAGIGLALLAGVSDVEPNWDRLILAAPPLSVVTGAHHPSTLYHHLAFQAS
jgi:uncharacterized protein YyaL (SSP411 family)